MTPEPSFPSSKSSVRTRDWIRQVPGGRVARWVRIGTVQAQRKTTKAKSIFFFFFLILRMASAPSSQQWEALRKVARNLENEIEVKLVAFSKAGTSGPRGGSGIGDTSTRLLDGSGPHPPPPPPTGLSAAAVQAGADVESLLSKLQDVNAQMAVCPGANAHVLQRHREVN
jgi:hypothetical protein